MNIEKSKSIIEAILFASGRTVKILEIAEVLDISGEDVQRLIETMKLEYEDQNRGIEIIKVENGYQFGTKKEYYEYIYPLFDNRNKPNLTSAALETLAIIAYNPKITRAEIEQIRGVSSDSTIYKLLEYNLIEDAGKSDAPGRPFTYKTTNEFLKKFGISSLDELPKLPKYKIDENEQIVIENISIEEIETKMQESEDEEE